jgi:hypothetical protein
MNDDIAATHQRAHAEARSASPMLDDAAEPDVPDSATLRAHAASPNHGSGPAGPPLSSSVSTDKTWLCPTTAPTPPSRPSPCARSPTSTVP